MKISLRDELPLIQDLVVELKSAGLNVDYNPRIEELREFLNFIYRVHRQISKSPNFKSYEKALIETFEMSTSQLLTREWAISKHEGGVRLSRVLIDLAAEDVEEVSREHWAAIIDGACARRIPPNNFVQEFDMVVGERRSDRKWAYLPGRR